MYLVTCSPQNAKTTVAFFEARISALRQYLKQPSDSQLFMIFGNTVEKLLPEKETIVEVPLGIEIPINK